MINLLKIYFQFTFTKFSKLKSTLLSLFNRFVTNFSTTSSRNTTIHPSLKGVGGYYVGMYIPPAPLKRGMETVFQIKNFEVNFSNTNKSKITYTFKYFINWGFSFLLLFLPFFLNAQTNLEKILLQVENLQEQEKYTQVEKVLDPLSTQLLKQEEYSNYLNVQLQRAINFQLQSNDNQAINILETTLGNVENYTQDSLLALTYHKLGVSFYNNYQEQKAIENYKIALQIRKKLYPNGHVDIAKSSGNIGIAYKEQDNFDQAEKFLLVALEIYQKLNLNEAEAKITDQISQVYRDIGDFEKSKYYAFKARDYYLNLDETEAWILSSINNSISILYLQQDSLKEAITFADRARKLTESIEDKYDEDYFDLANIYNSLGLYHYDIDKSKLAVEYLNKAVTINQQYPELRQGELARNYANLSLLYQKKEEYTTSLHYINNALKIDLHLNVPLEIGEDYLYLGEILLEKNDLPAALVAYQNSITYLLPDYKKGEQIYNFDFSTPIIGDRKLLIKAIAGVAKTYQKQYNLNNNIADLQQSVNTYRAVSQLIDRARFEFQNEGSKKFLLNTTQPILAEAVAATVQLFQVTKNLEYAEYAFEFSERSKALILLEAVNDTKAKELAGIPATFLREEQYLNQRSTYFSQQLFSERQLDEPNLTYLNELNDSLLHYNVAIEKLVEKIEQDYPQYFQLKYTFEPISIHKIQTEILTDQQTLLEYFVADSTIFAFQISPQAVHIETIERDFPLQLWIEELTESITVPYSSNSSAAPTNHERRYADRAFELYQKLWSFTQRQQPLTEQVVVVPDGILGYIPFAALLSQTVENQQIGDNSNYNYLIKKHQISYSYSATLLQEQQRNSSAQASKNMLAFAPTFGQMSLTLASNERSGLAPLIHNRREVNSVTNIMNGDAYYGAEATREMFLKHAPDYRYIHLSSHARMNDWKPEYSYISFTQAMDDSLDKSAILYVDDLYNVPLNADMVVLSACETATGKLSRGEGIISLARAFSYAGANSIITTLWRVNDQKSADLMVDFYQNLADGQTKDAALRQAQLRFIEEGTAAHPYFWAGFVPLGNMTAIQSGGSSHLSLLLISLGIFMLLIGVYFWRKSNK